MNNDLLLLCIYQNYSMCDRLEAKAAFSIREAYAEYEIRR